jgi:hypothetical protein
MYKTVIIALIKMKGIFLSSFLAGSTAVAEVACQQVAKQLRCRLATAYQSMPHHHIESICGRCTPCAWQYTSVLKGLAVVQGYRASTAPAVSVHKHAPGCRAQQPHMSYTKHAACSLAWCLLASDTGWGLYNWHVGIVLIYVCSLPAACRCHLRVRPAEQHGHDQCALQHAVCHRVVAFRLPGDLPADFGMCSGDVVPGRVLPQDVGRRDNTRHEFAHDVLAHGCALRQLQVPCPADAQHTTLLPLYCCCTGAPS